MVQDHHQTGTKRREAYRSGTAAGCQSARHGPAGIICEGGQGGEVTKGICLGMASIRGLADQGRHDAVTNGELESYGVNREMKRRAIHQYEKAGLITVERRGREAVTVTVGDPDYTHA
jgi:hypothetical protein